MLKGVTISAKVMLAAMERGTPTWSMERLGSGVMTVRAEKSTRLPMRFPRTRPSLPFSRCFKDLRGRPDFCMACEETGWAHHVVSLGTPMSLPLGRRAGGAGTHAGQAGQLVVHHGGHMELQELHVLSDDVRCRAVLLIAPQLVVDLHDVCQLVRQVVLWPEVRTVTDPRAWPLTSRTRKHRHDLQPHHGPHANVQGWQVARSPGPPPAPAHNPGAPATGVGHPAERRSLGAADLVAGRALHHHGGPHG